jgi:hypothetical protein
MARGEQGAYAGDWEWWVLTRGVHAAVREREGGGGPATRGPIGRGLQ